MLYTPANQFGWNVANFSSDFPGATGTLMTADGAAHTKGTDTALLAGIAEDCYAMSITFTGGSTTNTIRRQMTDILIDPAAGVGNAGSSWSVLINNLYTNSPSNAEGATGSSFYFPLYLKAGTAIGARTQDVVGAGAHRLNIRVSGKPTRPELLKVGSRVQTIGATTGTTVGHSFTPGNAVYGSWSTTLGTLTHDSWFWQMGVGVTDASQSVQLYRMDISAISAGGTMCLRGMIYHTVGSAENCGKTAVGETAPYQEIPSGNDVYVRGASIGGAPDTGFSAVVYAVS